MLPGFRFLFGAIVLCFSILVFGLGAAALFRAAHEEFASRPSWRAAPGTMLAQQNEPFAQQSDPPPAVLALLEVVPDDKEASDTSRDSTQEPGLQRSASEPTAAVTPSATDNPVEAPKLIASSPPEEPSPVAASEPAKDVPTTPEPETLARLEPAISADDRSAEAERAAPPAGASEAAPPAASPNETASTAVEPSTAASEPITVPAAGPQPTAPAPQIAALGPAEATNAQTREREASNESRAKAYRNFIKNRLRAQRAAKARRRLAHRARIVRRVVVQQQPQTAFGLPAMTTLPPTTSGPAATHVPTADNPYRF